MDLLHAFTNIDDDVSYNVDNGFLSEKTKSNRGECL